MQDRGLSDFKSFTGLLQATGNSAPVTFCARIDESGEVVFDFGTIALTGENSFIMTDWAGNGSQLVCFTLSGKSGDGIDFKTEDLHFISVGFQSDETGSRMIPVGSCSRAEFHWKLAAPVAKPLIRMHLKGFQNFHQLRASCPLGTVVMDGATSIVDPDVITGSISVEPADPPADLLAWRTEVDKMLEHIRRIMSLASATVLRVPIIEFYAGEHVETIAYSQTRQQPAPMRVIHYLDQQPIFETAVQSFFSPPTDVKNLFFAIEWFAMDSTYNEVRLFSAMTVLENLVASNLGEHDTFIKKNGKRNRRPLLNKVKILAEKWAVPLDGISEEKIRAAKRARDLIVHRGHYYDVSEERGGDLWEHVTVVREIVVRFLLTAIGYQGSYLSYVGGYHQAQYRPPAGDTREFTRTET